MNAVQGGLPLRDRVGRVVFAQGISQIVVHEVDPARPVGLNAGIGARRQGRDRVAQPARGPRQTNPGPKPLPDFVAQARGRRPGDRAQAVRNLIYAIQRLQATRFRILLWRKPLGHLARHRKGRPIPLGWAAAVRPGCDQD